MVFFEKHGVEEQDFFRFFPLKNYQFPLHFHRAYELIYINEGTLKVSVDQKEYTLEKGDLVFVFTNQMHEFKATQWGEDSEITIILFSPELIGDFYTNYKGLIPRDNVLHLENMQEPSKLSSIYSQKSFLYDLCNQLVAHTTFMPVKQSPQTKILNKILLYVEENYATECTLKSVAKHLQYDYPYLSKLFVQLMNITFTDYLNHYRISQAYYLLKNSNQAIGEVAINCGYNNLRTFHRNFREIGKQSPKEYRRRV